MTPGSHARPTEGAPEGGPETRTDATGRPRRPWGAWRIGTPLVILLSGGLFVVSAENSQGTDLRPGRYTDLASLVRNEADDYADLKKRVSDLTADVAVLTESVNDSEVKRYQRKIETLKDPAGLVERTGPGVRVTLSDAPEDLINSTSLDLNRLVVHQQDIQAVVNAMWKAGASAVTIQGQRVVSTTGIKCEGNAVQLQGVPYSQPYVIEAVGDQGALLSEIENDEYLSYYQADAENPEIQVGWELDTDDSLTAPAFDGLLDLNYAEPLP